MNANTYTIIVDLTLQEMEYFMYRQYTKKITIKILIGFAILTGICTLIALIRTQDVGILQGFILPAIVFVFMPFSIKSQAKKVFESSGNQFQNNEYIFNQEGVSIKGNSGNSNFSWDLLFKIEEDKKQVLLFVNSSVAHILPKRCFKSHEEQVEFFKFAIASQKIN